MINDLKDRHTFHGYQITLGIPTSLHWPALCGKLRQIYSYRESSLANITTNCSNAMTAELKILVEKCDKTPKNAPRSCVFIYRPSMSCCCSFPTSTVTCPIGQLTLQNGGRVIVTFVGAHVTRHLRGKREYLRVPSDGSAKDGARGRSFGNAG